MKLRLISRVLVLALVVIVGSIIVVHDRLAQSHPTTSSKMAGIDLGGEPAPNFALVDQNRAPVSLEAQRGHPVVLTFLYTHCPDECPLTAEKLHTTVQSLGPRAADVRWLVVSIDPVGDTPADASQFVAAHHLTGQMQYLLGTQSQLQPIWDAYHIAVQPGEDAQAQVRSVTHSLGVFVIDGQGHERAYFDQTFSPEELTGDLRALLG
ncbi:MAG: SCO family protein [Ktedonobacterales bacterium]